MKDSILCCAFCVGLGMVLGGVLVSNNAKVRRWVIGAQEKTTETINAVKTELESKSSKNGIKEYL